MEVGTVPVRVVVPETKARAREGPMLRNGARRKIPGCLLQVGVSAVVALVCNACDAFATSAFAPTGAAQALALGQHGPGAAAGRICMPLLLGRSICAARPVPLQLHMQERSRQFHGGQQRGRGGRRWGGRGGRGREGRDDASDGDGGGMSTDYVRGGGATLTLDDRLDEKLNRFLQRELEEGGNLNFKPGRGDRSRGRGGGVFTPRGLGRSNFNDDDGNVQRGRVCAACYHAIAEPPLTTLLTVLREAGMVSSSLSMLCSFCRSPGIFTLSQIFECSFQRWKRLLECRQRPRPFQPQSPLERPRRENSRLETLAAMMQLPRQRREFWQRVPIKVMGRQRGTRLRLSKAGQQALWRTNSGH